MSNTRLDRKLIKRISTSLMFLAVLILSFSCRNENTQSDDLEEQQMNQLDTIDDAEAQVSAYSGEITGINTMQNEEEVTGNVSVRVEGDLVRFTISASNLAPDMMHRQFLVASRTGGTACPGPNADANNDGIIDMNEIAGNASELQMIPLHMGPSSLERNVDTYPRSNVNGELQFTRTTSLDSIRTAVREGYGIQDFNMANYVYIVQGVTGEVTLQQTVQREENIPANETVPVGCAVLNETEVY